MKIRHTTNTAMHLLFTACFLALFPVLQGCNDMVTVKFPTEVSSGKSVSGTGVVESLKVSWMTETSQGYEAPLTIPGGNKFYHVALPPTVAKVLIEPTMSEGSVGVMTYTLIDAAQRHVTAEPKVASDYEITITEIHYSNLLHVYVNFAGKIYTIELERNVDTSAIYVSSSGDRLGGNNEYTNKMRGFSPGTAYYSLTAAVRKAVEMGVSYVVVLSDLDSDGVNAAENGGYFGPDKNRELAGESVFYVANTNNRIIHIVGRYNNTSAPVTLSGGNGKRVFTILGPGHDGPDVAYQRSNTLIQFDNVVIAGGGGGYIAEGGGIYVGEGAVVTISATSEVSENKAMKGGGVYVTGFNSCLTVEGKIHNNEAVDTSGQGGGIWVGRSDTNYLKWNEYNPPALVLRGEVHDNTAGQYGGGLYISSRGEAVHGGSVAIFENGAAVYGNNSADYEIDMPVGGKNGISSGVYFAGSKFTIRGNAYVNYKTDNFLLVESETYGGPPPCKINVDGVLDTSVAYAKTGSNIVVGLTRDPVLGGGTDKQVLLGDYALDYNYKKFKYNFPANLEVKSDGKRGDKEP